MDREPLASIEYDDVEVDWCVACGGIWLDAGELELLLDDQPLTKGFLTAGTAAAIRKEKPRKCPICLKTMAKATVGAEKPIVYDTCPAGHGLWFDKGELDALLEHGSPAPGGEQAAGWLRGLFRE